MAGLTMVTRALPDFRQAGRARSPSAFNKTQTKWDIDPESAQRNCFSATVEGYSRILIQPALMTSFARTGATRVVLKIIIPSESALIADAWNATVCPINWPTNYSLLQSWYLKSSLLQHARSLYQQDRAKHLLVEFALDLPTLEDRIFLFETGGVSQPGGSCSAVGYAKKRKSMHSTRTIEITLPSAKKKILPYL